MDRIGRVPVIAGGFAVGAAGCALTAVGCAVDSSAAVILGFVRVGAMNGAVLLARTAAADMYPPERRTRAISYVLFGALFGAALSPARLPAALRRQGPGAGHARRALVRGVRDRPRRRVPRAHHPPRPADDRALELELADPGREALGARGAATRDPAPARSSVGSNRGARELRGDGVGDEPERVHRRAPPRQADVFTVMASSSACTRSCS